MNEKRITCPCCKRELKITEKGTVIAVGAFFDKKINEQIAMKLKSCGYEFGRREVRSDE